MRAAILSSVVLTADTWAQAPPAQNQSVNVSQNVSQAAPQQQQPNGGLMAQVRYVLSLVNLDSGERKNVTQISPNPCRCIEFSDLAFSICFSGRL